MSKHPFDIWRDLRIEQTQSDIQFNQYVASTLCNYCFSAQVANLQSSVADSIPIMTARLLEASPDKISMDIAYSVAKLNGAYDITTRNRKDETKLIYEASLVVIIAFREDILTNANIKIYQSMADFLEKYSEFQSCNADEQKKLFEFANWMKYAILLIPPKYQKAHLLDVVTRLTEGQRSERAKYITGGGQTEATSRRVRVYETESGTWTHLHWSYFMTKTALKYCSYFGFLLLGVTKNPWPDSRKQPQIAVESTVTTNKVPSVSMDSNPDFGTGIHSTQQTSGFVQHGTHSSRLEVSPHMMAAAMFQ